MALDRFFTLCLSLTLILMVPTTSGLLEIQNGACRYRKLEKPGDVKLLVMAGMHESNEDTCGSMSESIPPLAVAVEWTLALLNGQLGQNVDSYIPGISIGYDLYDNCDSVAMTTDILYSGSSGHVDCTNTTINTDVYIGAISLTSDESTLVLSRLIRDLPVIRPLPSTPLLNQNNVPNLQETVISFMREAETILDVLRASEWTFVAIIQSENKYGDQAAAVMQEMMKSAEICVSLTGLPDQESLNNIYHNLANKMFNKTITIVFLGSVKDALGFIQLVVENERPYGSRITWVFTSHVARHPEVKRANQTVDHFVSIEYQTVGNNEYETYLDEVAKRTVDSPLSSMVKTNSEYSPAVVDHVVDAVTTLVHAAKILFDLECPNGSNVVCDDFKNSLSLEEHTNFVAEGFAASDVNATYRPSSHVDRSVKFTAAGLRHEVSIDVKIYSNSMSPDTSLVGVSDDFGHYTHQIANGLLPSSACKSQCLECVRHLDLRFSYLDGEVLILGLFSLHTYGGSPFSCGGIRREINDPVTVSAFMESIKQKRLSSGIKYGGIAIDDCYLAMNTTNFLGDLFSKKLVIKDPQTDNVINFDNVFLIVGALSSDVTVMVADMATNLGLPMISYAASSPELDNRIRYPLFRRTVPSDTLQAKGIVELIVSKLQVTRVGAVYINDNYGKAGIRQITEYAKTKNLCIIKPLSVSQEDSLQFLENNVVKKLYDLHVRVVIFFAIDSIALDIAKILKKDAYNSQPLIFVASDGWGTNQKLIANGAYIKGSIVFNTEVTSMEINSYKTFLQNMTAASNVDNKWIPTFFEDYSKCNFLGSFEKQNSYSICGDSKKSEHLDSAVVDALVTDQRAVHTSLAVTAAVEAYGKSCGKDVSCSPMKSRQNPQTLIEAISDVTINDRKLFDVDGNGNIGFTIFNIQMDSGTLQISYEEIGTYSKTGDLSLSQDPVFYNDYGKEIPLSEIGEMLYCDYSPNTCADVCLPPETSPKPTTSPEPITSAPGKSTDTTLLVVVIITGVLTVVLATALILVVCLLLRRSTALYEMSKQVSSHKRHVHSRQSQDNIYHTPSDSGQTIKKKRPESGKYDNPAFDVTSVTPVGGGSMNSLEMRPVQYAAISQTSLNLPQQSNLLSLPTHARQWSDIGPGGSRRPPEWTDMSRSGKRPGTADHLDDMRSTRSLSPAVFTPNSAPTQSTSDFVVVQDGRGRALSSSPRFRFSPVRDQQLDDIQSFGTHEAVQYPGASPEGYLVPGEDAVGPSSQYGDGTITYLCAKDFVNTISGDEEEVEEEEGQTVPFTAQSNSLTVDSGVDGVSSIGYDPGLISPSNEEIIGINYQSEDINRPNRVPQTFKPTAVRSPARPRKSDPETFVDSLGDSFPESPVDEGVCIDDVRAQVSNSKPVYEDGQGSKTESRGYPGREGPRSHAVSSISDVPDIIKHRAYEEENVFII